ncbi:copper resistance CopC family protein [Agromyces silvae]|uniref:copper resistance CopC family protein n=1 Tax=Agromyces silvae TaxID=3388266 RepID=UPI00280A7459|nr:copper resistance protein CopC [Agromyces protaetiae]
MSRRRSGPRAATLGAAVAVLAALTAGPNAWAHAELISTAPAPGEPVAGAPTEVTLTFSEDLLTAGAEVLVTDQNAKDPHDLAASDPVVDGSVVTVELEPLADGDYEVMWRVVSADGHPVLGAFSFFVGAAAARTQPAPGVPSFEPDTPVAHEGADPLGSGLVTWLVLLTLAAGAALGIAWWLMMVRRRHRGTRRCERRRGARALGG